MNKIPFLSKAFFSILLTISMLFISVPTTFAAFLDDWTELPPGTGTGIMFDTTQANAVAYGNGKYVVVGQSGKAAYSSDGITWTYLTPGTSTGIKFNTSTANGIAFGNGIFVVGGQSGAASYSSDGINWTTTDPLFSSSTINGVDFVNGKFYVGGGSGKASYSTDGINWTSLPAGISTGVRFGTTSTVRGFAYGNGTYVAVGDSGKASYSTDGVNWTELVAGAATGIKFGTSAAGNSVAFGNNTFIVVGGFGSGSYSTDGINWTAMTVGSTTQGIKIGGNAPDVLFGGGYFLTMGGTGRAAYSTDAINWTGLAAGTTSGIRFNTSTAAGGGYGNGKFIVVGQSGKASYTEGGPTDTVVNNNSSSTHASSVLSAPNSTDTPQCGDSKPLSTPNLFQIDTAGTYANLYFTKSESHTSGYAVSYGLTKDANIYGDTFDYNAPDWIVGHTIRNLEPNTTYYFKVQPVNGCIAGEWSNTVQVKTKSKLANVSQFFSNLNPFNTMPLPKLSANLSGSAVAGVSTTNTECLYTIKDGDSLWAISNMKWGSGAKYGDIVSLNPTISESSTLKVGSKLSLCK